MGQPERALEAPEGVVVALPSAPVGVAAAAMSGDRRALLVALRDNIAREIDGGVAARDLASLSLRLMAITEELEGLGGPEEEDDVADAAATPDEAFGPS